MKEQLTPEVAIVVAAYNESDCILQKIQNCFALDYPLGKLKIHIVSDGSTDDTPELVSNVAGVKHYYLPERRGKLAAVERIMDDVKSPIVVFTDANCLLNRDALKNIVRHYNDPSVGGVAGEKKVRTSTSAASQGEGLYWKYESWLKKNDSELCTVVGAAGELFSFRRELFERLPADTIIEDFVLSMRIAMKGYKVVYEPGAVAIESSSSDIREEWKRKVRICAGGFQSLRYLDGIFNPFRHGWLTIQFISHRFLRWAIVPFILPVILITLALLAMTSTFYLTLFAVAVGLLLVAIAGLVLEHRVKLPKIITLPGYILMMNAAAYAGLYRYVSKSQSQVWEKARRAA